MRFQMRIGLLLACVAITAGIICAQAPPAQNSTAASTQIPARLTLEDARRIALQNHPRIRAAQSAAAAANDVTTETRSAFYPIVYGSLTGVVADSGCRIAA